MKTVIVIPTFNEVDNIAPLLQSVFQELGDSVSVLFIDDSSVDGTIGAIQLAVDKYGEDRINYKTRPIKMGLGSAYLLGFKWALSQGYEQLIQMDADRSHPTSALPDMISQLQTYDVVIGSRYISGGGTENWGIVRKLISRMGSTYARLMLGVPIRDFTGGFNGWNRRVIESIDLDAVKSEGYSFQIEMKYRAAQKEFKIKEIPIVFVDRITGTSKMSLKIALEALWRLWLFRFSKK